MPSLASGNVRSGIFGLFGRHLQKRLSVACALSGCLSHYDSYETRRMSSGDLYSQHNNRNGYSICCVGDVRYNFSKNEKFSFGPLVALSYRYVEQNAYSFFLKNNTRSAGNYYAVLDQFGKTLLGEVGMYGAYDCCARAIPVKVYGSITIAGILKKPDPDVVCRTKSDNPDETNQPYTIGNRTSEPSSYINVRLGVTSAVSKSIDLNADVKGSFAKDYYDVMGAVGMSYNF